MNQKITTGWVPIFMEIADKLLRYKNNRKPLVNEIYNIYDNVNNNIKQGSSPNALLKPPMDKDNQGKIIHLKDICPFTIFGIINRKMKNKNRTDLLDQLARFLKINRRAHKFNFSGESNGDTDAIPYVHNFNYKFFPDKRYRNDRKGGDIDKLWNMFEKAINYADNPSVLTRGDFIKAFDGIVPSHKKGGVKQTAQVKLSEGLYWIRPCSYPTLSVKKESKILSSHLERAGCGKVIFNKIDGEKYLEITDALKKYFKSPKNHINNFIELSFASYHD